MGSIRVEQKQFASIQRQAGRAVDDMGGGTAAHIDHFNIIMFVGREVYETGMGADIDQLPRCKHFPAVHYKFGIVGIKTFLDVFFSGEKEFFLFGDFF